MSSRYPAIEAFVAKERSTGLLLFLMILPNLIWISLHRGLWPSDACANGLKATSLHYALFDADVSWWQTMSDIGFRRPPLFSWIAQFLVPVGELIGNIDVGLLLLPFVAQFVTLLLTHRALSLLFKSRMLALLGCLVIASAPVFIEVGKQLQTQPMQLPAAAWFLYIMAHARKWNSVTTLLHLVSASAFAILTMLSTPAFCLVPGVVALYEALKKGRSGIVFDKSQIPLSVFCLVLVLPALLWSYAHGRGALATASNYYGFPWGAQVEDVFRLKLAKWADFLREGFFVFPALVFAVVVSLWALSSYATAGRGRKKHEASVALLALLQVMLVLIIFASSQQQTFRYILPFASYVGVLVVWSVFQIDRGWITRTAFGLFLLQFAVVNASDYGVIRLDRRYGEGTPLQTRQDSRLELIDGILDVISEDPIAPVILEMRALSLDGEHVTYEAFKKPGYSSIVENIVTRRAPPVHSADKVLMAGVFAQGASLVRGVDDLGTQTKVDIMWKSLLELEPGYFVMPSREIRLLHFESVKDAVFGGLVAERLSLALAERVVKSPSFERVDTSEYPELEIYRYRPS